MKNVAIEKYIFYDHVTENYPQSRAVGDYNSEPLDSPGS